MTLSWPVSWSSLMKFSLFSLIPPVDFSFFLFVSIILAAGIAALFSVLITFYYATSLRKEQRGVVTGEEWWWWGVLGGWC